MSAGGAMPAGSSRTLRLDPSVLPVRYTASDAGADGRVRQIELHREHVLVRRAVRGIRMKLDVPLSAYRGIALRIVPPGQSDAGAVAVTLEHRDPGLSIPLFIASETGDVGEQWRSWGDALDLPLLVVDADGRLHDPLRVETPLATGNSAPRRRRCNAVARRRSTITFRRARARLVTAVFRGEREIIARD